MLLEFFTTEQPTRAHFEQLERLAPCNPFCTDAYANARSSLGTTPVIIGLQSGASISAGCVGFVQRGRLNTALEIVSFSDTLSAETQFWHGFLRFCKQLKITSLEVNTFGSAACSIPPLPGEVGRQQRAEYVWDLDGPDLLETIHHRHKRQIRKAEKAGMQFRTDSREASIQRHTILMKASMDRREDRGEIVSAPNVRTCLAMIVSGAGELFQAVLNQEAVSSALVLIAGHGAYLHSAGSSPEGMQVGGSQLLQHRIAEHLRSRGIVSFNLGGASESQAGLAQFKSHFGTRRVSLEAAQAYLGSSLRRKVGAAVDLLREPPSTIVKELSGSMRNWLVFSADPRQLDEPVAAPGLVFRKLSDAEVERLPGAPADLLEEQRTRLKDLGRNSAYGVFCDGALAHVSWLIDAQTEPKTGAPLLSLGPGEAEITACFTLSEFRGKGLYRFAILSLARELPGLGIHRVFMKTRKDNIASQHGITGAGLRKDGRILHYRWPASGSSDVIWRGHR
jgi:hypothetical protein